MSRDPVTLRTLLASELAKPTRAAQSRSRFLQLRETPSPRLQGRVYRSITRIPSALLSTLEAVCQGEAPWPLYLYGSVGSGKTCAALVLCDYVPDSIFETDTVFCSTAASAAAGKMEWYKEGAGGLVSEAQLWAGSRKAPLVVIDEIGSRERVSDFAYKSLLRLLDEREGQPTILIGNLSIDGLTAVYDERIASRIIAGTVVYVQGDDMRDPRRRP